MDDEHRARRRGGGGEGTPAAPRPGRERDGLAGSRARGRSAPPARCAGSTAPDARPSGLGDICAAHAASKAEADDAVIPSSASRRTASRRVIRPSTQSSPTSVVRYSRSAMGPPQTTVATTVPLRFDTCPDRRRFFPRLPESAHLGVSSGSWRSSSVVKQGTHKPTHHPRNRTGSACRSICPQVCVELHGWVHLGGAMRAGQRKGRPSGTV